MSPNYGEIHFEHIKKCRSHHYSKTIEPMTTPVEHFYDMAAMENVDCILLWLHRPTYSLFSCPP